MSIAGGGGRVIVVGSINVDLVVSAARLPARGETVTGGTFEQHHGGKGANQAVAAARMGARVHLVGAVGRDPAGEAAVGALLADGIDTAGVARVDGTPTGVALIVVDAGGENQIAVAPGANALVDGTHVESALARLQPGAEDVLLTNLELPDEAVLAAAGCAARSGMTLLVNPAPARPLGDALLSLRPLLIPNAGEALTLTGGADPAAAAALLAAATGTAVIVTLGASGALLVDGESHTPIAAPTVDVVDTTGAGDTFAGALAAELARSTPLADAARVAVRAASLSVTARGAREGMPRREQVERARLG